MWWYGAGDVQPPHGYEYATENLSTTEDATECTDQLSPYKAYPVYATYRVPKSYGPGQYYYPIRRRPRRRVAPFTMPYEPYGPPNPVPHHQVSPTLVPPQYQQPQARVPLKRRSRRSLLMGRKRRSEYHVAPPAGGQPLRQPPLVRRKHKMFVYSEAVPTDVEDGRAHPKVYWRKIKKTPGRGKVISWCREAVESETSNDGKSVRSTYSKLSVDVTNEMEAMNRDIETILSRYESSFDQNILHELEERGLGKKKKVKQEVITKTVPSPAQKRSPPPLTEEQKKILSMEKPPLDRLAEIPIEYLKPRPPQPGRTPETTAKSSDVVWRTMLKDLLSRGVMNNLDQESLNKFQSTLYEVNGEASKMSAKIDENRQRADMLHKTTGMTEYSDLYSASQPKTSLDVDYVTLASGARIPNLKVGSGLPSALELEEFSKPVEPAELPELVDPTGVLLPVNKVDDHSNWRKTIDEIREVSQAHCDQCKSLAEQLNEFRRGGSGDKLFTVEEKFVNTEKENLKEDNTRMSSKNFSFGDQKMTSSLSKPATAHGNENYSLGDAGRGVPGITSNITVHTALTGRTKPTESQTSVNTARTSEESMTNPSSATELKAGIGVAVEDVGNEEEVPLQRKQESIRLGKTNSSTPTSYRRRLNTPTSQASTVVDKKSENKAASDLNHGCGDSGKTLAEKYYQEITSSIEGISSGKMKTTSDLDKNLAELSRSVTDNAALLNTGMCVNIIRKLLHVMMASEPVLDKGSRPADPFVRILSLRKLHMQHIESELNHIEQIENDSLMNARVKAYFLPPFTSSGDSR